VKTASAAVLLLLVLGANAPPLERFEFGALFARHLVEGNLRQARAMMLQTAQIETTVPNGRPDLGQVSSYLRSCPISKLRYFEDRIILELDCGREYDSVMLSFKGDKVSKIDFGPPPPPFNIAPRPSSPGER
jgi:hypothetical protein